MEHISKRLANLSPKKLALLDRKLRASARPSAAGVIPPRSNRTDPAPLSFAQERLWFLDQFHPGNSAYNLPLTIPLNGSLNLTALTSALNEMVQRHEVLRTSFRIVDAKPLQVIEPQLEITPSVLDLRHLPEQAKQLETIRRTSEEMLRSFDLGMGPLMRALLLRQSETESLLFVNMHHIVSDGWSQGVFVREFGLLYDAFCNGRPSPLPELHIQYADFAVWQREYLAGDHGKNLLDYWRQQLEGAPSILNLPLDYVMPATRSFQGAVQYRPLKNSLSKKLKNLAQAENISLFVVLLAGFKALLYRYTGQKDLVVGSPIANRNYEELERLIGFFVNTLVLRVRLSGDESFQDLLKSVRDVTLDAYAHQDFPFEWLVAELLSSRDPGHNPLFQVMFGLQNANALPDNTRSMGGAADEDSSPVVYPPPGSTLAKFDLVLTGIESGSGVTAIWEYRTDIFQHATITRMAQHFETLLESALDHPAQPLSSLNMLDDAEVREQVYEWSQSSTTAPVEHCLHDLIALRVEQSPEAIALIWNDETLTFRELDHLSSSLARRLRALGIDSEKRVGICMHRSPTMIASILAVLQAGGVYVPLDPSYPTDRLVYMAEDAGLSLLLTQEALVPRASEIIAAGSIPLLAADSQNDILADPCEEHLQTAALADNLAYIIYTSGSTGKPKGVMISHRAIVNHMRWMLSTWPLGPDDRILQRTPISFDASIWELFAPLMSGAALVLSSHDASNYDSITSEIVRHEVTVLQLVPSLLRVLLDQGRLVGCHSLRRVYCGGEALSNKVEKQFYKQQKAELYNLYGPTEAAIEVSSWKCSGDWERSFLPLGRPITNAQIYILDKHLNAVPSGLTGELYIGGECLARGYINRPDLTAELFIPSPFGNVPGGRLYRTGDLARFLPDGNIEFVGRSDHQVKIRGFRIELAEIETALLGWPEIETAAVIDEDDNAGGRRLVAYVVPKSGTAPKVESLRAFVGQTLPAYMVPAAFVLLEKLPVLPNGKLNRAALPKIGGERPMLEGEFQAPGNEIEEKLSFIWQEVIGLHRIGINDNFFALGGHSLMASQVVARIRDTFHIELPLSRAFESPTISELSLEIRQLIDARPNHTTPHAVRSEAERKELLSKIDQLSEEEIDSLLQEIGTTVALKAGGEEISGSK